YHVVFVPKYRRKSIYGTLRKEIGGILRELCRQQGVELIEGYAMRDHIHMLLMIPPKYSVANTIGFLKGKSAIRAYIKNQEREEKRQEQLRLAGL
ncbi:IS200/IS605 family transposase, partial [Thiolapillus sp.]